MRKSFYKYLSGLFKSDQRVMILLGDIGVFAFSASFEYDKTRIYNMGIMEQTMMGVASGLSSRGFIPFVHSIAPFVTERCYEQLKIDLGYECRNVFVVSVGNSYDYAGLGTTHHCTNDLRIVNAIPNFKVYCPGNSLDVERIIASTLNLPQPKYIRLSEHENNLNRSPEDLEILKFSPEGVTVVLGNAIRDYDKFLNSGLESTVLYTTNVSDFDVEKFNRILSERKIKRDITVVEPCSDSGIISAICQGTDNIARIRSISVPKEFIDKYGSRQEIDKYLQLDADSVIKRIKSGHNGH